MLIINQIKSGEAVHFILAEITKRQESVLICVVIILVQSNVHFRVHFHLNQMWRSQQDPKADLILKVDLLVHVLLVSVRHIAFSCLYFHVNIALNIPTQLCFQINFNTSWKRLKSIDPSFETSAEDHVVNTPRATFGCRCCRSKICW